MLMSSSFSTRSAESLDSTPTQASARTSRHRSNLSANPVANSATNVAFTPSIDFDQNGTHTYSKDHYHNNHRETPASVSTDIAHNNNKTIKDTDDVGDLERKLQTRDTDLNGTSPTPGENCPMSQEQNSLDQNQHDDGLKLKVNEASRTSEMPDLSEQPSTFTRSNMSTATLMADSTKERSPPSHNASFKIDEQVRNLKQRMALSEDGSLDDKVSHF